MPLKNISTDGDNAKHIREEADKALSEAKALVGYYEALTGNKVPVSVHNALDGEWRKALSEGAQELLEHYPEAQKKEDRRKLVRLEDAVKIMVEFENAIITASVRDPVSVLARPLVISNQVTSYALAQAPKLLSTIADILSRFKAIIVEALKFGVYELLTPFGFVKFILFVAKECFRAVPVIFAGASALAAALAAGAVLGQITKAFGQLNYKLGVKQILNARKQAETAVRSKVLFARDGSRYPRRKRSRK